MPDSLDAHAHLDPGLPGEAFAESGFVLAQTISLVEAESAQRRTDDRVVWGVGCHPRLPRAQDAFSRSLFADLIERTAVVGEVGLDSGSRVSATQQLATFRAVLDVAAARPRIVSIHSFRSTAAVLDELERRPIVAPALHWWTGTADETRRAVRLGCYFSIHSAVARRAALTRDVPLDRMLVESDHGDGDPPAAIPLRIGWVEHLVGQRLGVEPLEVRSAAWHNFARLIDLTRTKALLPAGFARALAAVDRMTNPRNR